MADRLTAEVLASIRRNAEQELARHNGVDGFASHRLILRLCDEVKASWAERDEARADHTYLLTVVQGIAHLADCPNGVAPIEGEPPCMRCQLEEVRAEERQTWADLCLVDAALGNPPQNAPMDGATMVRQVEVLRAERDDARAIAFHSAGVVDAAREEIARLKAQLDTLRNGLAEIIGIANA